MQGKPDSGEGTAVWKVAGAVFTGEAADWLTEHGYDPSFGARPLKRLLQKAVADPLALELLDRRGLFRRRHIRCRELVFQPFFLHLERRREGKNRPTVLDCHDTTVGKTAAIPRAIDFIDYRRRHVTATQEIGMKRVRNPALDRVLRGRQGLAEHLAAKHLRAADVAAVTSEYVVFDPLELQKMDEVLENRVHQSAARPPSTAMPVPLTNTASSLARNRATLATSTGSPRRRAADALMQKSRSPGFLRNVSRLSGVMTPPG